MSENDIELLRQQIASIDIKKFDLEAWKAPTLVYVSRIFGSGSEQVRQIRELKYDYSSWTLRDTSGGGQLTDPVKMRAREILEAAIAELQNRGDAPQKNNTFLVRDAFQNELSGRQMHDLDEILQLGGNELKPAVDTFLTNLDRSILQSVLVDLLTNNTQQ